MKLYAWLLLEHSSRFFSRYGMQYDFLYHDYIFLIRFVSEQVVVKFDMPSTCNISHLIVDLVTHIGLEAEQHGGGSEVLVRAWDRLANKAVFFYPISILYNYLFAIHGKNKSHKTIQL